MQTGRLYQLPFFAPTGLTDAGRRSSLSVEDATHEHLDVRCGKHNQARKRTAVAA